MSENVGIDVGASEFHVIVLSENGARCEFPALWHDPASLAKELRRSCSDSHVAVDAPLRTSEGLLRDPRYRERIDPPPPGESYKRSRECDYHIRRRGIRIYQVPLWYSDCDSWVIAGFSLYDALLSHENWTIFDGRIGTKRLLEVYPYACYSALLDYLPPRKNTRIGRETRLAALDAGLGTGWSDHAALANDDEVDAAVCALTALRFSRGEAHWVGNPREALMVIPAPLRDRYHPGDSTRSTPADPAE